MFPKILIVTPTYEGKDYVLPSFLENIKKVLLATPNSHLIVVDNSPTDSYLRSCRRKYRGVSFAHVKRGSNSRDAITNSMNYARHYAIRYGYEYIMVVEVDVFPPPTIALKLYSYAKRVVGATYFLTAFKDGVEHKIPCIFVNDVDKKTGLGGTRLITPKEWDAIRGKGVVRCHGMGLGCTLISKEIFELFPFWNSKIHDGKHHDVYFYADLNNANIPVFVDTATIIEHRPSRWDDVKDK